MHSRISRAEFDGLRDLVGKELGVFYGDSWHFRANQVIGRPMSRPQ